jgi:hypothetical protein
VKASPRPAKFPSNPTIDELLSVFNQQGEKSGIVGIVAELGSASSESEAFMLAKVCGNKLAAVVVENQRAFDKYYKKYKDSKYAVQLVSFRPYPSTLL